MASLIRNGGALAPTGFTQFYEVPADKDEKLKVRATNVSGSEAFVYYEAVSPDGTTTLSVCFNGKVAAGDAVDIFPAGLELGAGWKVRHRASVANAIATFFSAVPAA